MFMMYRIARLFKLALFILFVLTLYFLLDRWLYERLLNSLYITFDDFPLDYAEAMKSLSNDDRFYEEYNYAQTPKYNTSVPLDTTIPPIIHFIWFENLYETTDVTNIPSMGSNAPHRCQKVNPDFDVKVWNASAARDLLEQYYDWFLPTYDNYPYPIQRVDAIKYFVLHHYGGFYLDLDITCRRSLTPLRPFPAWVVRIPTGGRPARNAWSLCGLSPASFPLWTGSAPWKASATSCSFAIPLLGYWAHANSFTYRF